MVADSQEHKRSGSTLFFHWRLVNAKEQSHSVHLSHIPNKGKRKREGADGRKEEEEWGEERR